MNVQRTRNFTVALAFALFVIPGCASHVLEYEKADEVLKTDEYDKKMKIVEQASQPAVKEVTPAPAPEVKGKKKKNAKDKAASAKETPAVPKVAGPHQPDIEDSEGFVGRRPIKDPFRPGEKVVLNLSYFNIVAGTMEIMVKPMVEVNGQKAYHFVVQATSNSFFNRIYGINDTAVTYMTYDDMTPLNLQITLKETKQLAEARTFFDWKTLKASYWQKRVTKEHGEESKKLEWDIKAYSQNVISAAFYMRTFQYDVGKKLSFRVADEGKNIVYKGEVIRKEKISTEAGDFNTIVIKPHLTVDGVFTPVGDVLVWLTDDDRKFIVRLESKIKIGTIVAKLKSLEKGQE
jgi:hypothetical protein